MVGIEPVEVGADTVEDLAAELILLPLVGVELQHRLVHQVHPLLHEQVLPCYLENDSKYFNFKLPEYCTGTVPGYILIKNVKYLKIMRISTKIET
jgi:hypothetical protein